MLGNGLWQRAWPILPLAPTGNIEVTSNLIPEKSALSPKCSTHVTSMLPLSRRGNVPQTLCHRPFPSMILPRYLILRKTLKNKNSCFYFVLCPLLRIFAPNQPQEPRWRWRLGLLRVNNNSISYYFAYSQKRRKLFGNKRTHRNNIWIGVWTGHLSHLYMAMHSHFGVVHTY